MARDVFFAVDAEVDPADDIELVVFVWLVWLLLLERASSRSVWELCICRTQSAGVSKNIKHRSQRSAAVLLVGHVTFCEWELRAICYCIIIRTARKRSLSNEKHVKKKIKKIRYNLLF